MTARESCVGKLHFPTRRGALVADARGCGPRPPHQSAPLPCRTDAALRSPRSRSSASDLLHHQLGFLSASALLSVFPHSAYQCSKRQHRIKASVYLTFRIRFAHKFNKFEFDTSTVRHRVDSADSTFFCACISAHALPRTLLMMKLHHASSARTAGLYFSSPISIEYSLEFFGFCACYWQVGLSRLQVFVLRLIAWEIIAIVFIIVIL